MLTFRKSPFLFVCLLAWSATISHAQSSLLQNLSGQWTFIASPFDGGREEITFTATPSADGTTLSCHADAFRTTTRQTYTADWTLAVEQSGDTFRLGWMLDANQPITQQEFQEPQSSYCMGGADADGTPRYIYLLSENIDTQQLEAMTLWTDWQTTADALFTLPKIQQIYAVVSQHIPYAGAIGYIDIWASGKLQKCQEASSIQSVSAPSSNIHCYDLTGRRLHGTPDHGLYIRGGKKYFHR